MKPSPTKIGAILAQVALLAMAFFVTVDVILRYLFNRPILYGVDIVGILLLSITFLGLAHTEKVGGHVNVNVFVNIMPEKAKRLLNQLTWIIELCWVIVICTSSFILLRYHFIMKTKSTTTNWLLYPFVFIIFLGGILVSIEIMMEARRPLFHFRNRDKNSNHRKI